jgi:hypothetical protein
MARMVALVSSWWNLFVRLGNSHKHHEASTRRPPLLHGVATKTQHGGRTTLTITSQHAKQATVQVVLTRLAAFLGSLKSTAEQLTLNSAVEATTTRTTAWFNRLYAKTHVHPAGERQDL